MFDHETQGFFFYNKKRPQGICNLSAAHVLRDDIAKGKTVTKRFHKVHGSPMAVSLLL